MSQSESKIPPIPCSILKGDLNLLVEDTEKAVLEWSQRVSDLRNHYPWLLYFGISRMLHLYDLIQTRKEDETLREVSFLADSQLKGREKLREGVKVIIIICLLESIVSFCLSLQQALAETACASSKPESPMQCVGQFLSILLQNHILPRRCPVEACEARMLSLHSLQKFGLIPHLTRPLYSCPAYSQMDFICLILNICSGIPEAYQVLRCQETTMEEEVNLFLKRAERHCSQYFLLNIKKLPYKLQEVYIIKVTWCAVVLYVFDFQPSTSMWPCKGPVNK